MPLWDCLQSCSKSRRLRGEKFQKNSARLSPDRQPEKNDAPRKKKEGASREIAKKMMEEARRGMQKATSFLKHAFSVFSDWFADSWRLPIYRKSTKFDEDYCTLAWLPNVKTTKGLRVLPCYADKHCAAADPCPGPAHGDVRYVFKPICLHMGLAGFLNTCVCGLTKKLTKEECQWPLHHKPAKDSETASHSFYSGDGLGLLQPANVN